MVYESGQIVDVSPDLAAWLLRDAPGCFELVAENGGEVEYRDVEQLATYDRMIRRPGRKR